MSDVPLEKLEGTWPHLKRHYVRQSLFLVSGSPILEVARAVADDKKDWIAKMIQNGGMRRPTPQEVLQWESDPNWKGYRFPFVIVQPFVFVESPIENY